MSIIWIDLETTGLLARHHRILEVAAIVTDDKLVEVARFEAVTDEARNVRDWKTEVDPYVREMHCKNGLWGESIARGQSLAHVARTLVAFLDEHAPAVLADGKATKPPIGGSTVSFDRSFLEYHMPEAAKRFSHRHVDVSTMLELAMRLWPAAVMPKPEGHVDAHRAMPDIEWSLKSARWYAKALQPPQATADKVAEWMERAVPAYGGDVAQAASVLRKGTWA